MALGCYTVSVEHGINWFQWLNNEWVFLDYQYVGATYYEVCSGTGGGPGAPGGDGGGGAPGGTPPPPTQDCPDTVHGCYNDVEQKFLKEESLSFEYDNVTSTEDPDCTKDFESQALGISQKDYKIWCNSTPPEGLNLTRTNTALNQISSKGGVCEAVADFGRNLLSQNRFKYYSRSSWGQSGGLGGEFTNGGGPMIVIMEDYVSNYYSETFNINGMTPNGDYYSHEVNLEWAIIHELDHAMGYSFHLNNDPWLTPNVKQCSGLN